MRFVSPLLLLQHWCINLPAVYGATVVFRSLFVLARKPARFCALQAWSLLRKESVRLEVKWKQTEPEMEMEAEWLGHKEKSKRSQLA